MATDRPAAPLRTRKSAEHRRVAHVHARVQVHALSSEPPPLPPLASDGSRAAAQLPNVDPKTGVRDAAVPFKVLLKFRKREHAPGQFKPCFGCNAVVGGEGVVRVGDRIEVAEWAEGTGV